MPTFYTHFKRLFFRVYPKLRDYITNMSLCAYPALEIYDSNVMHFFMPLSRQEEFFVPEFSEEQVSIATTEVSNADHAAVDSVLRTSSRNSTRKSEDRRVSEDPDDVDHNPEESGDSVFVKPTKPAPKKVLRVVVQNTPETM